MLQSHITVGSLLLSALQCSSGAFPELFQSYSEQIFEYLILTWPVGLQYSNDASPLNVMFEWKPCADGTSPIATRPAAIYFPKSADFVAACYRSFDRVASLEAITTNSDAELLDDAGVPEKLTRFRGITACVAISIEGRFAPKGFASTRHSPKLDLCFPTWLRQVCTVIDQAPGGTIELHKAIVVLVAVHAGGDPVSIEASDKRIIAWRQGIYAVVPSLLLSMDLVKTPLGSNA